MLLYFSDRPTENRAQVNVQVCNSGLHSSPRHRLEDNKVRAYSAGIRSAYVYGLKDLQPFVDVPNALSRARKCQIARNGLKAWSGRGESNPRNMNPNTLKSGNVQDRRTA